MDRVLIEEKLESLRRCLVRIKNKRPAHVEQLAQDPDLQDIITLNLTRAVQLSVDIAAHWVAALDEISAPATMGGMFEALAQHGKIEQNLARSLKAAVGFRNIAVHNYEAIDWQVVYAICTDHLEDFADFAKTVFAALPAESR
ncbi:MAG: DUF86 domain-containing protein [Gammaproteobacteria bacterium]|nr:MAG: DUF86 domain-containing protein [Gammaproteobacteria bacterium]